MSTGAVSARFRQDSEGERLVACLRWLREQARCHGPYTSSSPDIIRIGTERAMSGFGVFFWKNPRTNTCFQYSPFTPIDYRCPDDPVNGLSGFGDMGSPGVPISLGSASNSQLQFGEAEQLSGGLRIYFQTDTPGKQPREPAAEAQYPSDTNDWKRDRVIFWPPGIPAPSASGNPWGTDYGPTLPEKGGGGPPSWANGKAKGRGNVTYNRIYIASDSDQPPDRLPVRIHIHPGTGLVRLMSKWERRPEDGSW